MLITAGLAWGQVTLSGSIQSDVLIPQDDETIGTEHYSEWARTNTYVDLKLGSKYVDAGGPETDRINKHDRPERRERLKYRKDPENPDSADTEQGADRRKQRFSKPAEVSASRILQGMQDIGKEQHAEPLISNLDNFRIRIKEPQKEPCKDQKRSAGNRGTNVIQKQRGPEDLPAPLIIASAKVLSDKGRDRLAESIHDKIREDF